MQEILTKGFRFADLQTINTMLSGWIDCTRQHQEMRPMYKMADSMLQWDFTTIFTMYIVICNNLKIAILMTEQNF